MLHIVWTFIYQILSECVNCGEVCLLAYERGCLRVPPRLLIEARWCVETVNVFPWISEVGRALIDSDLTALHALSHGETIVLYPLLLSASLHKLLCFCVLAYTSSLWRWMMHVSRAIHKRRAIMSSG